MLGWFTFGGYLGVLLIILFLFSLTSDKGRLFLEKFFGYSFYGEILESFREYKEEDSINEGMLYSATMFFSLLTVLLAIAIFLVSVLTSYLLLVIILLSILLFLSIKKT